MATAEPVRPRLRALPGFDSVGGRVGWNLALAVVYLAAAKLGLSMSFLASQVSPVWPPAGIALAAVLLFGSRLWPGIALGAVVANATAGEPLGTALAIGVGNTLEAVVGAALLRRASPSPSSAGRLRDVVALVALAAGLAPMIAATIGTVSLCLGGVTAWAQAPALWWVWWLGDAMGALVLTPLLLAWSAGRHPGEEHWSAARRLELLALLAGLAAVALLVFARPLPSPAPNPAPEYAVFPFVIWSGLRFRERGVTLVAAVLSTLAIVGTLQGGGPFAGDHGRLALVLLQTYLAVVTATGLFLAAAINERDRAERAQREASQVAERELRERASELATADRRKDEFLAMLAHELRNPLAAIASAVDAMRGMGSRGPAEDRLIGILDRQAHHLARLVDDLLEVSRITFGDIPLRCERVLLNDVVARAVEAARTAASGRRHAIELATCDDRLLVDADPARLEQVVTNLLANSIKYTDPGGHIRVEVAREGDTARLRVSDDGQGISPELLPHVFDLFTQGDRSLDRAQGGLGIGLTLVHRIVELHGGTVQAESEGPGRGSVLTVRLPLADAVEARLAGPPPGEPAALR